MWSFRRVWKEFLTYLLSIFRKDTGWITAENFQREQRELEYMLADHWNGIAKEAQEAVQKEIADHSPKLKSAFFYGATDVNPKNLVFWYLFDTDSELACAKEAGLTELIAKRTREELKERRYLARAIANVSVAFCTYEDIQNETGGDQWAYFK